MFEFLDNMFNKQPEVEETPPTVEEAPEEEEVEEEVVAPEPPPIPEAVPVGDKPEAAAVLSELWGVSVDEYNEALSEGKLDIKTVEFVQKLLDDKYEAERKLADLARFEELPAVQESKAAEKLVDTWTTNIDEWSEELFDTLPNEVKLLKNLGKKKTQELQKFIEEEAGIFLLERLKTGKKVINPLLVKGNLIAEKIKELSGEGKENVAPPEQAYAPANRRDISIPQPPKPSAKKVASLAGASPVPETPNLSMSKAAESFLDNISFFTMGHKSK